MQFNKEKLMIKGHETKIREIFRQYGKVKFTVNSVYSVDSNSIHIVKHLFSYPILYMITNI